MADPDELAVMNLRRNKGRKKCLSCNGAGQVMKYIRPRVVGMVECIPCRGTGAQPK
jgi:DnaJ-class molecular chaperone